MLNALYDWGMTAIRVSGIGDSRRSIAKMLMDYMDTRPNDVVPGTAIRALFVRHDINTWEGSKVLGILRNAGVIGVVAESEGSGPMTWRRTYRKLADWDSSVETRETIDLSDHEKRAYERPGTWIVIPSGMDRRTRDRLQSVGFQFSQVMRFVEGEKLPSESDGG